MRCRFLDLAQGTKPWHQWRRGRVTASDIPAIAGVNPPDYRDANAILLEKLSASVEVQEETFAMRKGKAFEPYVRKSYERAFGIAIPPVCVEHVDEPLGASLDGWNEGGGGLVAEIKYAKWQWHDMALEGIVPEHFDWQIQTQLLVSGAAVAELLSFNDAARFRQGGRELAVVAVLPDPARQAEILDLAREFWARVEQARKGVA